MFRFCFLSAFFLAIIDVLYVLCVHIFSIGSLKRSVGGMALRILDPLRTLPVLLLLPTPPPPPPLLLLTQPLCSRGCHRCAHVARQTIKAEMKRRGKADCDIDWCGHESAGCVHDGKTDTLGLSLWLSVLFVWLSSLST